MANGEAGGRGCFKTGCLVVLGCFGLFVMVVTLVVGLAWMKASSSKPESQVLTQPVPETPAPQPTTGAPATPPSGVAATAENVGRVVLDLADAEIRIEPGPPGQPIRIEASYDKSTSTLEENFEPGGEGPWTYTVTFRRTGGMGFFTRMFEGFAGKAPKVHVFLPPDVPLDLDFNLSQGESVVRLGGLWLTNANVEFSQGGIDLSIDQPLKEPIEHLAIKGSMGGGNFQGLGNASPRQLEVDFSMGGMALDLRGQWVRDADIRIQSKMGGAGVRLPTNVVIEGLEHTKGVNLTPSTPQGSKEIPIPVLRFSVSSAMGEVEFR